MEKELIVKYLPESAGLSFQHNFTILELILVLDMIKAEVVKSLQSNIVQIKR